MNSEGWNCTGPIASQLVFPPTSMPSGVATTRNCNTHEAMSTGHAMRIQKLSGMRLASSIAGMPMTAKTACLIAWSRNPPSAI